MSRMVRKMKVSETEMCSFRAGIRMVMREPIQSVVRARKKNRMLSWAAETLKAEKTKAAAPSAIIAHIYGFAYCCLLKVVACLARDVNRFSVSLSGKIYRGQRTGQKEDLRRRLLQILCLLAAGFINLNYFRIYIIRKVSRSQSEEQKSVRLRDFGLSL